MKNNQLNKNQNGRSMVEMLGVLAIIGVLSVGGIAGYSKAMFKYKMNKTIGEISSVLQNIVELDSKNIGSNIDITDGNNMIKYGLMPQCEIINTRDDFTGCKIPLGYIMPALNSEYNNSEKGLYGFLTIGVTIDRLNSCIGILSYHFENIIPQNLWGKVGYISITSDSTTQQDVWTLCNEENKPENCLINAPNTVSMNDIQKACNTACKDENCEINFVFRQEY